jgi:pimeloyl-ACP methyl ester carboxylesterase
MGMIPGLHSGFAPVSRGSLYYEVAGAGSPVVFIPGFTLDTRMWDDQIEAFVHSHRVIRYDLRGAGKSPPPTGPYRQYEDLAALLRHLAIKRAHIVGLSLGGATAIDFALASPAMMLSLVPVASSVGGYPWPQELDAWLAEFNTAAGRGDITAAKEAWMSSGLFESARRLPVAAAALDRIMADYSGWHFRNKNPVERLTPPANDRLESISAPTLVIVGELDLPFYTLPIADALAARIPGARKVVVRGAGHLVNMESPAYFNEIVLDFIARVDASLPGPAVQASA